MPGPTTDRPLREIDGSVGGGQILRSSLALSIATGEPFVIRRIRDGRPRKGLMRQHLTAVRAAATVGGAEVRGAELGSRELSFRPSGTFPGEYSFVVSTAGSAALVLQTVLPPLIAADAPSFLELRGGTHAAWAPPFDFLDRTLVPILRRLGADVELKLTRHGFYPAGGGRFIARITPTGRLDALELLERGDVQTTSGRILIAEVPKSVGNREVLALDEHTGWGRGAFKILELPRRQGPGNAIVLDVACEHVNAVFTSFGKRGVRAERVAELAARQAVDYLAADAPVDCHLADQLLLPLALNTGGAFRTLRPLDDHFTTNAQLIREWLDVSIDVEDESERVTRVTVET